MKASIYPGAYGGLPGEFCQYKTSSIAVLPVPYDGTSTWMKGSYRGPKALLDASAKMELYDIETNSEVFRQGIVTIDPVVCSPDPEVMVAEVYRTASSVFEDGKFLIGVGGEHTISVGTVRASAERVEDLSVLQFDAHTDTRDRYNGSRYNHACVMSRIGEICPYVHAGIRSMDRLELKKLNRNRTFFARDVLTGPDIARAVSNALTDNVYITIDLDVFDPSIMPSTGTPEPGGLDWYTLLHLIERVVRDKNVVGIDVTELLPNPDNKAPDFLAAKLIYRVLSMVFSKPKDS